MATKVKLDKDGKIYFLIGCGYGSCKSLKSLRFIGNIFPLEVQDDFPFAALCGQDGKIVWAHTDELTVVEIDGDAPESLIQSQILDDLVKE